MHIDLQLSIHLPLEVGYVGWLVDTSTIPKVVAAAAVLQGTWRMVEALVDTIGVACWNIRVVRVGRSRGIVGELLLLVGLVRVGGLVARELQCALGLEEGRMVRVLLVEAEVLGSILREAEVQVQVQVRSQFP
jgi:hypothetical protein